VRVGNLCWYGSCQPSDLPGVLVTLRGPSAEEKQHFSLLSQRAMWEHYVKGHINKGRHIGSHHVVGDTWMGDRCPLVVESRWVGKVYWLSIFEICGDLDFWSWLIWSIWSCGELVFTCFVLWECFMHVLRWRGCGCEAKGLASCGPWADKGAWRVDHLVEYSPRMKFNSIVLRPLKIPKACVWLFDHRTRLPTCVGLFHINVSGPVTLISICGVVHMEVAWTWWCHHGWRP
jgi:hypothetical protein